MVANLDSAPCSGAFSFLSHPPSATFTRKGSDTMTKRLYFLVSLSDALRISKELSVAGVPDKGSISSIFSNNANYSKIT